ncbi:MAG: alpha/beta fold hydrolase [Thermoleophilia bacterium]|nr:alpha/beta fold hydrolase [Thermoleophilia bacterium]
MVVESDGTTLYWETAGSGEPVLLVMGLGMPATGWWRTIPVLARRFRVIAFDNRGCGRSGRPRGPYSLAQLVGDALAVLDAAGEQSAHVYGISLGGMVAQELALRAPSRVRSLVLGATTAGGAEHELPDDETVGFLRRRGSMPPEEGVWASIPYMYGPATLEQAPARVAEDLEQRLRFTPDRDGYLAQLAAAWTHDTSARLEEIGMRTLVLHGNADRIVPIANGRRLAERLPDARFHELDGAGHLYMTDAPDADQIVLRFLRG